jgi:hypothetical protein
VHRSADSAACVVVGEGGTGPSVVGTAARARILHRLCDVVDLNRVHCRRATYSHFDRKCRFFGFPVTTQRPSAYAKSKVASLDL